MNKVYELRSIAADASRSNGGSRVHSASRFALLLTCSAAIACGSAPPPAAPETAREGAVAAPGSTFSSGDGPTADQVADETLMYAMAGTRMPTGQAASLVSMRLSKDPKWIAPLIEMVRVAPEADSFGTVLQEITGRTFGMDWPQWVEWYGTTEHAPPYGFARWKGELFAEYTGHETFRRFLHGDMNATVRVEEIVWGGVGPDGIPPLENPAFVDADTEFYDPKEFVLGVSLGDDQRAYPLRIMSWHEMANDVVDGRPVTLAYCTLCGAAILYDGTLGGPESEEVVTTFGTSGLLMRSNKLMYDRATESLWNQITGEAIAGPLAGTAALQRLPVTTSTWGEWKARYPDTKILSPDTGHARDYSPGKPYGDYFASEALMFPVWRRSDRLPKKEVVFALIVNGVPKAYPLSRLSEGTLKDEVGGTPIVLKVGPDAPETDEPAGRSVRAFRASDMAPLAGHNAFWFGWFAYYPRTEVHE